jgi:1-acyl-sn-glycerol-3-phosphate acyltransferase
MPKIWEHNRWYNFARPYVDFCTRESFGFVKAEGELPSSGAVIIAPNHTNTLLDAMLVLQTRKGPTVFGARADIFRKPAAQKALRFLRILPLTRERDGLRSVTDNYKSFDKIDDVLAHGVPFCLFPEGRHTPGRTLQPIQKGIARIAFRSAAERQTWVVPTGINYGDFFHFRRTVNIKYGEPIDVNAFLAQHADLSEAQQYQTFRDQLYERISALVWPSAPSGKLPLWQRILLFPFWLLAAILSFPMWLTAEILCSKIKDKAFCNSVRLLVLALLWPVVGILWAVLFFCFLPWWLALMLLLFFIPSYSIFYEAQPFIL